MPLVTHPWININQCLQVTEEPTLDITTLDIHPDWQRQFLDICQLSCDWNIDTTMLNAVHMTRHIGGIVLCFRPIPESPEAREQYHNACFWDGESLVLIRFDGEQLLIPIQEPSVFIQHISEKKNHENDAFLHYSADQMRVLTALLGNYDLGNTPTYTHTNKLIHNLKVIYARLTHQLSPHFSLLSANDTSMLLAPLADDIVECTEGFYNRTQYITTKFSLPQSISSLLTRTRTSLVDTIARQLTHDIHIHTRVFTIAHELGFGVSMINAQDTQVSNNAALTARITQKLHQHLPNHFRPFYIIQNLVHQLKLALAMYGYDGTRAPLQGSEAYGYTKGEYEQFITYLQMILGPDINSSHLCLDANTQSQVVDLEWISIKFILWQKLVENGCFLHPIEWVRLSFLPEIPSNLQLFEHEYGAPQAADFVQFLTCFYDLETHILSSIIRIHVRNYILLSAGYRQNLVDMFIPYITNHDERSFDLLFDYFKQHHLTELKQHFLPVNVRQSPVIAAPKKIKMLVGLIDALSLSAEKQIVYKHCGYLLINALWSHSPALRIILHHIIALAPEHLINILRCVNSDKNNVLMMCMKDTAHHSLLRRILNILLQSQHHLNPESIVRLLSQCNRQGDNALLLAAQLFIKPDFIFEHHELSAAEIVPDHVPNEELLSERQASSDIVSNLITLLESFTSEQCLRIFAQQNEQRSNLLMTTIEDPVIFLRLLNIFKRLNKQDQMHILGQSDMDNYNILMLATVDCYEAFLPILSLLNCEEDPLTAYTLLSQINTSDIPDSIFLGIAKECPQFIKPILQFILPLSSQQKTHLIKGCDDRHNNFFMLVLQLPDLNEETFSLLLNCLTTASNQEISPLMIQENDKQKTALKIAKDHYPAYANTLRRHLLNRILDGILTTAFTHTQIPNALMEIKMSLLDIVNTEAPVLLKETFLHFSRLVIQTAPRTPCISFFTLPLANSMETPFRMLDCFGDGLTSELTGGYANSKMINDQLLADRAPDHHIEKKARIT